MTQGRSQQRVIGDLRVFAPTTERTLIGNLARSKVPAAEGHLPGSDLDLAGTNRVLSFRGGSEVAFCRWLAAP